MQAHRTETTIAEDGVITLRGLPFQQGEVVEVIVLPAVATSGGPKTRYPLRGASVTLLAPTEPVADGEWEAGR